MAKYGDSNNTVITDEKRTTLSLSLTVSDKKALKMIALQQDTTIAAVIHEWIVNHSKEKSENK